MGKDPVTLFKRYLPRELTHKLYLIKISDSNECFYKIGISKNKYSRFYQIMKTYPNVTIIFEALDIDWWDAMDAETLLHKEYKNICYLPKKKFGGYCECFSKININDFKSKFKKIIDYNFTYIENLEITWR